MEHFDDLSLMEAIQAGNRDAFAVLVNRYSKYYFAIIYRFVSNREITEDILQTAWLKLWGSAYKFNANLAGFKTWFTRSVVNLCIDDRRARRQIKSIENFEIADARMGMLDILDKKHKYALMQNAINKLAANYRIAINLGIIEEMHYSDVAKIMHKSEGAVKILIIRAKEQLKDIIQRGAYDL
jgi:RNA polymerase sigma-70 factor (ECF subfamily)